MFPLYDCCILGFIILQYLIFRFNCLFSRPHFSTANTFIFIVMRVLYVAPHFSTLNTLIFIVMHVLYVAPHFSTLNTLIFIVMRALYVTPINYCDNYEISRVVNIYLV